MSKKNCPSGVTAPKMTQKNTKRQKTSESTFKTMLKKIPFALVIVTSTLTVDSIYAEESLALEEIVVTGRKRSENLQEVPAAIIAIPSETIERANIGSARDVVFRIPNVTIVESLSPTSTYINVRGIASTRNSEPAVSLVVDGVQVGSATEVSQSFHDVEQIELLKGPQGSLYGRNALGGALVITSKKPSNEMEGRLKLGTGDDGLFELSTSISGPINDKMFFRFSANHRSFDGNIENEYLSGVLQDASKGSHGGGNSSSYMDFEENNDYRAQFLWEPTEATSVSLTHSNNDIESGSMWYRNIFRLESDASNAYEFPINSNGNPTAFREIESTTLKIDHELSIGTLTSITNFTDTSERYGVAGETRQHDATGNVFFYTAPFISQFIDGLSNQIDADFFSEQIGFWREGSFVGSDQYYDVETVSQELRIVSNDNERLRYVGGLYILKTERDDTIRATMEVPAGAPFDCASSYPGGPSIFDGTFDCSGILNNTQNSQDNTAWAVYLNVDYDLTDEWTLTLGARYDEDDREVTRIDGPTVDTFGLGVGGCDSIASPEGCAASGSKISNTFSAFQPKISISYQPTDSTNIYATYARGFRSGGFNASGALLTDKYDEENLDSFEVGMKNVLMEGRLRTSFALFHQRYENAQQFEFDGNVFVQSLYNIPKSEITGFEGQIDFAATESLTVSGAIGIMDTEITDFDNDILTKLTSELNSRTANTIKFPGGTQKAFDKGFKGYKLPMVAHTTANLSLQHEVPVAFLNNRMLTTRIDYSYSDDLNWWIDNEDTQDSLSLLEASIGFELSDNLEVQVWCKNCTDKVYDSEFGPNERELFGGAAKDVAYQARLRTYGIRATYWF